MKDFTPLIAILLGFAFVCFVAHRSGKERRANLPSTYNTQTNAKIVGVKDIAIYSPPRTYIIDDHGHSDKLTGIWGNVGDTIVVTCKIDHNGRGYLRLNRGNY